MKNKFRYFIIITFFILTGPNLSYGEELLIKALKVETFEEGNIIHATGEAEAKTQDGLEIFANIFQYNKDQGLLIASGEVKVLDLKNQVILKSELIHYTEIDNKITSYDNTDINIKDEYFIETKNLNYKFLIKQLFSKSPTIIIDNFKNKIELQEFKYFIEEEIVRGKTIYLHDNEDNKYYLEDGIINLTKNILLGKDIKVNFTSKGFEVPEGEPRLKGNSMVYGNNGDTIIQKGIFTTCKKNDTCPPWSITSKTITHKKQKKQIHYKNAWLKIYDKPVMYFPRFFHPDPSVKRQSGFLKPKFGSSRLLGQSIIAPYFHVISDSADLTFKPRIFSASRYLLQNEYRKVTKNSSTTMDFGLNNEENKKYGTKTHFFLNSLVDLDLSILDKSMVDIKIERTSNDGYLKLYTLEDEESIIHDTGTLESFLEFKGEKNDFILDLSFESYETLGQLDSDRYTFVYPNYSLQKIVDLNSSIIESLAFNSYGNQRTHTTNIKEAVQVNDLIFSSFESIFKQGIETSATAIFKNVNSKGSNSTKFKKRGQSEILSLLSYDLSWPLKKDEEKLYNFLTPKISFKYSPNDTKSIKDNKHFINYGNIFSFNRIGNNESIEGGTSITLGIEYEKQNLDYEKFFLFSAANVIRDEKNYNLPITSTIGEKQSDFVGNIYYSPIANLNFDYNYSIDNSLKNTNLHSLETEFKINNFITSFDFYEENNLMGDKSYFSNNFKFLFDEENSLSFRTRRNKKNDLTEFYNLIYEYKNDCLTASLQYNKEYYQDNSIKPFEQLFFNITLIPLGGTQTNNLITQFEKIEQYKGDFKK